MTTEIELKYLLLTEENTDVIQLISQLLSTQKISYSTQQLILSNSYYDTDDLALRKMDVGLRVRGKQTPNNAVKYEQTIKTAGKVVAGLHQRPEFNVDIATNTPNIVLFPEHIWPEKTNVEQLQQQLTSLFDTNFTRYTWTITLEHCVIELAYDIGVISCQGLSEQDDINEIELELVSGDQAGLFSLAKVLMSQLAMRPGLASKAARGYALAAIKSNQLTSPALVKAKKVSVLPPALHVPLDIIPMADVSCAASALLSGVDFALTKIQKTVDSYVERPSLSALGKLCELFALLRQGFWLLGEGLTPLQLSIRDELSYFIGEFKWVDDAQHLRELTTKSGSYRKRLSHSEQLIEKLKLEKQRYPQEAEVLKLLHGERFNYLQLSLLGLLVDKQNVHQQHWPLETPFYAFIESRLTLSLQALRDDIEQLKFSHRTLVTQDYLSLYPLVIRSLLAGSWFASLFNDVIGDVNLSEEQLGYRRPWLDVKQGISELQTLYLLQQQLALLTHNNEKLAYWLESKVENLLQALEQSLDNALENKPYWQQ